MTNTEKAAEIAEEKSEVGGAEKRTHHKFLKVALVIVLEIALLSAGLFFGYTYAKATIEPVILSNYRTLEDLREYYCPTAEELKKDAATFAAEDDPFGMYKRIYYTLLMQEAVNVTGEGTTETNGGTVLIATEKKLESGLMYTHTRSEGTGLAASFGGNFDIRQYFDVESQLVKILSDRAEDEKKNGKVQSEQTYVAKYGLLPYGYSNYIVEEETIESWSYERTGDEFVLTLKFYAEATKDYLTQMKAYSGQVASFSDGDIEYKMYFDESFVLRKTEVSEKYKVMGMTCRANLTERYVYGGEEGYRSLLEEEKFANVGI